VQKKIIWSLFDSENAIVSEAIKKTGMTGEYAVYSFGKGEGTNHIHLDLSEFEPAKRELDKYPKPDYLFASPPCNSWSLANYCNKRYYTDEKVLNFYYKNKWEANTYLSLEQNNKRLNGENTALTTAGIIKHYSPKAWAIENGTRSKLFAYLFERGNLSGYKNLTNYYSYGFNYVKPTTIYSNCILNLKNKSWIKDVNQLEKLENHISGYTNEDMARHRSKVPKALYIDILKEFSIGGQKPLFQF
jgi:hypothetical protein